MLNFHFFHRHPFASVSLKCQTLTKSRLAEISFMVFVLLRFPLYIIFYRTNVSKRDNSNKKKSNRTVFSVHFAKGDKTRPLCFQYIFICSVIFQIIFVRIRKKWSKIFLWILLFFVAMFWIDEKTGSTGNLCLLRCVTN